MRFEQLQCLVEIANTGSITAAAKRLFVSQQSISANIKQLEEELQCPLLVREKNGVSLTPQGQGALTFARRILAEKEMFCNSIKYTDQEENLLIRICSTSSVTNIVLPNVIDRMEAKKKHCSLKIALEDNLESLFEQIENLQSDIGLLTFNAKELESYIEYYKDNLYLEQLVMDEMVGVLNKKFFDQETVQISSNDFHARRHSLYNIIPTDKFFDTAQNDSVVWSNDSEFHRAMLERNGTLVLMPALACQFFFSSKKYISLPVEGVDVPLIHAAVYRKDAPQYVKEFVNMIRLELYMK